MGRCIDELEGFEFFFVKKAFHIFIVRDLHQTSLSEIPPNTFKLISSLAFLFDSASDGCECNGSLCSWITFCMQFNMNDSFIWSHCSHALAGLFLLIPFALSFK